MHDVAADATDDSYELYHIVQAGTRKTEFASLSATSENIILALCQKLFQEGSATLVGDMITWPGDGGFLKSNRSRYNRNLQRLPQIESLFSSLIFRAYYDPEVKFDSLYPLAFQGGWDSSAYYLGYRMAQVIDGKAGRGALISLLSSPPEDFILTYNGLAGPDDPKFSLETINLIKRASRKHEKDK